MELDGACCVACLNDTLRGRNRAVLPMLGFRGTPVTMTFATPYGPASTVGLRCAAEAGRCAYTPRTLRQARLRSILPEFRNLGPGRGAPPPRPETSKCIS